MEVVHGLDNLMPHSAPAIVTLGAFDGVHRAHQRLIGMLVDEARRTGGTSVLITFDPLPRSVVHSDDRGLVLTSLPHKLSILKGLGLDLVLVVKFDARFALMTADTFLRGIVLEKFKDVRKFIVGPRVHFGHNAEGDAEFLRRLGEEEGFAVEVTEEMVVDDAVVSSTVIRKLVRSGELETAGAFLGRAYSLRGTVVRGMRIGRKLGFPTANIDPQNEVYPPSGVYAVKARVGETLYPGVLNIGYRPTLRKRDDLEVAIEAHILGFSERIYGSTVEIVFYRKLRQEKLFEDNEGLISQIRRDIAEAERILSEK